MDSKDIFQIVSDKYLKLDSDYKRAVLSAFLVSIIAYCFQLTHVIMSPDAYSAIWPTTSTHINGSGRWFLVFLLDVVLHSRLIVPTFNLLISIMILITSSLVIAKMWNVNRPLYVFFIATIVTANTYTNHIVRWENAILAVSITVLIAVLAMYFASRGLLMSILGLVLITCAHGGYQVGVSLAGAVIFAQLALSLFRDGSFKNFKSYLRSTFIPQVLILCVGFLLHTIILKILLNYYNLKPAHRLLEYHTPRSFDEVISNIRLAFEAVPSLFTHQVLYLNLPITLIFKLLILFLVVTLLLLFLRNRSTECLFLILVISALVIATLMSTYLPTLIIGYYYTVNRICFPFGIFLALITMMILHGRSIHLRNLAIITVFCMIGLFSWQNNQYSYRAYIQDRADFDLAGRVITRIENMSEFDELRERLSLVVIGTKDIVTDGYIFTSFHGSDIRTGAFGKSWSARDIFKYLHSPFEVIADKKFFRRKLSKEEALVLWQMEEWPSSKSVAIIGDTAVLMLDRNRIPTNVLEPLFTTSEEVAEQSINMSRLAVNRSIKRLSGDYLQIVGENPSIYFDVPYPNAGHAYKVCVNIEAPKEAELLFYYKTSATGYSEKRKSAHKVYKGDNECCVYLRGEMFDGRIRFDLKTIPSQERFRIRKVVVYDLEIESRDVISDLRLAADRLTCPLYQRWKIYWDSNNGFKEESSKEKVATVIETGELSFDITVPGNSKRLRIDAPADDLLVKDLRLQLEANGNSVDILLSNIESRQQVRNVGKNILEMSGRDPFISVKVPAIFRGSGRLKVQVKGSVMKAPNIEIRNLLGRSEIGVSIERLEEYGEKERAQLLRKTLQWIREDNLAAERDFR
jgi:hypothetical protein